MPKRKPRARVLPPGDIDLYDVVERLVPSEPSRPSHVALPEREAESRECVVRDAAMTVARIGARVPNRDDGSAAESGSRVCGLGDRHPTVSEDGSCSRNPGSDAADDHIEPSSLRPGERRCDGHRLHIPVVARRDSDCRLEELPGLERPDSVRKSNR